MPCLRFTLWQTAYTMTLTYYFISKGTKQVAQKQTLAYRGSRPLAAARVSSPNQPLKPGRSP